MMTMMLSSRRTRGMIRSSRLPFFLNNSIVSFHSRGTQRLEVGNVEDALKVFDEMLHSRPLPSVIPFTQIKCYSHLNRMDFTFSVLGNFFKLGLQPNVVTFSTLIHGFVLNNQLPDAARLFINMLEQGHCKPNVFTFSTLIKGFCKIGNNTAAITLLRKMGETGCQPNLVTYSTIIDSLAKDTLIDEAMKFFSEMISRGIAPNVVTYNCLIHGLCNIGRWNEATRLLEDMLNKGVHPTVVDERMGGRGCSPDGCTYNIIIRGLFNNNKTSRAVELIEEMKKCGFAADASTTELVYGLLSKDAVDPALLQFFKDSQ